MDINNEKDTIYIVTDELPTTRGRYFCVYGHGYKDGITWDGREADINWAKNLNAKFLKEISKEELAALQPSTLPLIDPKDLHQQVIDHIRNYKLFDWDEALTGNEMSLLEDMFMSFNPLCPPGSIGFEEQKRHIQKSVPLIEEKEQEAIEFAEWLSDNNYYRGVDFQKQDWFEATGDAVGNTSHMYKFFKNQKQ